jgi:hypothetical protein
MENIVMASQSYRERMKAARAEASAQRKAEKAARQRQIELRCEVHRLAMAAVKAGIQAKGQRKLSTYSRAELTMMANALIAPRGSSSRSELRSLNETQKI